MNKIVIISGAGISAPSGISTFRDSNGLWENHHVDEVCNIDTWLKNYDLIHKFYNNLRVGLENKNPNEAHLFISKLQKKYGEDRVINITQNIDNLFEKANVKTIHVHGELTKMECKTCNNIYDIGYNEFTNESCCPKCNGKYVKPFIIFFGENAPEYFTAKQVLNSIKTGDILLVIGTNGAVFPIEYYLRSIKISNKQNPICILNNLEKSIYISEHYFKENIFYESCIDSIDKIENIIDSNFV